MISAQSNDESVSSLVRHHLADQTDLVIWYATMMMMHGFLLAGYGYVFFYLTPIRENLCHFSPHCQVKARVI